MAPTSSNVPEDVQSLVQKYKRMKFFIAQYEEEWELLESARQACSNLVGHKERAKPLSLYGPGQPSQMQLKYDLNEWTNAQNNAMVKQDVIEVILQDYRRQKDLHEQEILKRGHQLPNSPTTASSMRIEVSPARAPQEGKSMRQK